MIEFAFFFYYISDIVLNQVHTQLYLHKACLANSTNEQSYNDCYNYKGGLILVSPVTSSYYRWAMLLLGVFYVSLATSWSDISGRRRKPLVIIAVLSQIMESLTGFAHYFFISSMIVTFISNTILEFIGGMNMMFVVAQIYICETSAVENRTMRLGLLWVVRVVCQLIGNGITYYFVYYKVRFFFSYALCFVLSFISMLLTALLDDKFVVPEEKLSFSKLFDATRIAHNFKLVFKKSLGKKRLLVLLLLIAYVLMYFVYEGENVFSTYYIINSLLGSLYATDQHWTALQVVKNIALIFSTLLCCVILSKCLKIRDVSIGIFASICNIIGVIFYFLVGQTWQLYVATMLNVCHGVILFTSVSFLSKFYDGKEFGRLFGVLNIFFCLALISKWAYATVFVKTIDSFPTAVYLSSLFLNIAVLVLYCISFMFWWLMSDSEVFEES